LYLKLTALEVYCDNLKRDEIEELLTLLEGLIFKCISVDIKTLKLSRKVIIVKYIKLRRD
jgi:hypothetical protein